MGVHALGAGSERHTPISSAHGADTSGEEMLTGLLKEAHQMHPDHLGASISRWAAVAGLTEVVVYVGDRDQKVLTPLAGSGAGLESIESSVAGRCYKRSEQILAEECAWFPVLDGTARIGVMRVRLPGNDPLAVSRAAGLASLAAYLIVAKMAVGDGISRRFNAEPPSLAAEMRWAALPPLAFECAGIQLGAMLQPAYEIAGDTFDYAAEGDYFHVAIFDAMGHGLMASGLANTAVYAYRLGRRRGESLEDIYRLIDDAIAEQFGDESFVTAQLMTIEVSSGLMKSVCAGHPRPLLLRNRTSIHELGFYALLPLGMGHRDVTVTEVHLQAGDTLILYSDGISEARSQTGEEFGIERLKDLLVRAAASDLTPPETARRALHAVAAHHEDRLNDDATLVLVRWRGSA